MMEIRKSASILGWVLLIIGVLGFVPGITSGGLLLGIFAVNGLHSLVHIVTGALLLWAARKDESTTTMMCKVLGVVYGLLVLLGLLTGEGLILGLIAHNMADLVLHIVVAAVTLYLGFGGRKMGSMSTPAQTM